jgi:hypothetical protein
MYVSYVCVCVCLSVCVCVCVCVYQHLLALSGLERVGNHMGLPMYGFKFKFLSVGLRI